MDALTAAIIALEENPPPKGDRGERGPTGDRGPVGPRGPQGPKGEEGEEGSVGRDGQDGEPGPKGDMGDSGNDGQSVERAEAYGLPPDRPPVAVFDNGLLRLGIPRGRRGPPGPAGYGGTGGGGVHPNLTAHSAIGLATDTALAAHAAGPHGGASTAEDISVSPAVAGASDVQAALEGLEDAIASAPYRAAILADSPVAYWRLGESSGTVAEDEVGANDGTYTNTPTLGVAGALSGDTDKAVTFNGTNEYVTVPDAAALDLGDILSIELWFRRTSAADTAERNLVSKGQNAYALSFNVSADHTIAFVKDNVSVIVKETGTTEDTNWHHVVVTKTGAAVKLYKDGDDVTGSVTNATLANTTDALNIGRDIAAGSLFWGGGLDEVALYNTVLSPARVLAHYAASGRLTAEHVSVAAPLTGNVQTVLEGGLFTAIANLTSAQLLGLAATPVEITAAPVAGKMIVPVQVIFVYKFVTTPYTVNGNSDNLHVSTIQEYTVESNGGEWGTTIRLGLLALSVSAACLMHPNDDASLAGVNGQALAIFVNEAMTGGDGTLTVITKYVLLDVP